MSRTRSGAALALLALALLAVPGGSSGDSSSPTWAGTWDSDFGRMTLDAGGSGSYEGFSPGTISGNVDGRVNHGTWQQEHSSGTFIFTMSGSGLSFTGDWEYDQGGCGSACGWNGTCVAGPCLQNDDPPPPQPPPCGARGANALVAAETCDLGSLPFGSEVSVPAPSGSETLDISPKAMPASAKEVLVAIRELLIEEEAVEILASLQMSEKHFRDLKDAFAGCMVIGPAIVDTKDFVRGERDLLLLRACKRLLVDQATPGAKAAAGGCQAVFVPAFSKGRTVTKRLRERAVAAARRRIDASCKRRAGRLSLSIRARGKGVTLPDVIGRRLRVNVARRASSGAPKQRLGVRWRARKR